MDKLEETLSEFNQTNIEIEEFKLLRQEIMYYNEAAFRTELYVVASCGIVWGWIVANSDNLNSRWHVAVACGLPCLLMAAGFVRYLALRFRVQRLAFYIYCIEHKLFGPGEATAGWEHFVGLTRGNNIVGFSDEKNLELSWKRQAARFRQVKYKWAFFTRSATWTWLVVFLLNVAAALYVVSI